MYPKRSWKYEKDVFGKKHRQYFLNNVFGADVYDMKTFRALKRKLERDYKGFFGSLNKLYERGEFKNVAKESLSLTNRVVNLIDSMIESGAINKKEVDIIVQHVGMLNERRDILVQKSGEVKALKGKLSTIESSTGIRPEDLNITGKIVRSGARREAKKGREGVLPFLKRTMPKTSGLAGEVFGGVATAGFGPFTPLAKMVGGAGSDIFGLGKGIFQKFGERNERKLGGNLRSVASQLSEGEVGGIGGARGIGTGLLHSVETKGRKVNSDALFDFYNKGAYRAKWTKELLKKTKAGDKEKGGILDILKSALGGVGKVLGSGGLVAGGAVVTGTLLVKLGKQLIKYEKALDAARKARRKALEFELKQNQKILDKFNASMDEMKKDVPIVDRITERIQTRENLLGYAPEKVSNKAFIMPPMDEMKKIQEGSTRIINEIQKGGVESLSVNQQKEFLMLAGATVPASQEELLSEVKKLANIMTEMNKTVKESNKRSSPNIKEPGIGNPWNSSDPFSNSFSTGNLEWSDE